MKLFEQILKRKFLRTKFTIIDSYYLDENNERHKSVRIKWQGNISIKTITNFIDEKRHSKTIKLFKRFTLCRYDFETKESEFLIINN